MEFRILEISEKNKIRPLYEEVFDDSLYFVEYYFEKYIGGTINFVCQYEGEIIGMATIHPKKLMVSSSKVDVGYVYGVATKPEYRGKGIMRRILCEIYQYAMRSGYQYLYLIPANPRIYEGLGYKLVRHKNEIIIKSDAIDICNEMLVGKKIFKAGKENIAECLDFLRNIYENKVSIFYDENYFSEILERLSINNSGIYCIFDSICDKILGLVFIEDDGRIMVNDIFCYDGLEKLCMKLVMNKLNTEELFYRINDIMFKEVHGSMEQLEKYSICINDEV